MSSLSSRWFSSLLASSTLLLAAPASVVTIEWVTVGDPGNPADDAFNCVAANCDGGGVGVGNVTDAGAFTGSASPNGTFDQGGNVLEWNEQMNGGFRVIRGGSFALRSAALTRDKLQRLPSPREHRSRVSRRESDPRARYGGSRDDGTRRTGFGAGAFVKAR